MAKLVTATDEQAQALNRLGTARDAIRRAREVAKQAEGARGVAQEEAQDALQDALLLVEPLKVGEDRIYKMPDGSQWLCERQGGRDNDGKPRIRLERVVAADPAK